MENKNPLGGILTLLGFAVILIILFPPLLIILLGAGIYFWFKMRSFRKQMEQDLKDQQGGVFFQENTYREPTYQDELFQEQVNRRREEEAEVIDVEFTRKDSSEEEKQSV